VKTYKDASYTDRTAKMGSVSTQLPVSQSHQVRIVNATGADAPLLPKIPLKNRDLYHDQAYVDGRWVEAKSGKRFEIIGKL